jgi:purine-binding chemotaxis protein CheW
MSAPNSVPNSHDVQHEETQGSAAASIPSQYSPERRLSTEPSQAASAPAVPPPAGARVLRLGSTFSRAADVRRASPGAPPAAGAALPAPPLAESALAEALSDASIVTPVPIETGGLDDDGTWQPLMNLAPEHLERVGHAAVPAPAPAPQAATPPAPQTPAPLPPGSCRRLPPPCPGHGTPPPQP